MRYGKGHPTHHILASETEKHLMPLMDKILLRKRSLIETVNDQLKNIAQVNIHVTGAC